MNIKGQTMGQTILNNFMKELNLQFKERKEKTGEWKQDKEE